MADSFQTHAADRRLLRLHPDDNVAAVADTIEPGETIAFDGGVITMTDRVPIGHKVAIRAIAAGEKVVKYGAPIGSATQDIRPGQYVHTHNLASDYLPTYTQEKPAPP